MFNKRPEPTIEIICPFCTLPVTSHARPPGVLADDPPAYLATVRSWAYDELARLGHLSMHVDEMVEPKQA